MPTATRHQRGSGRPRPRVPEQTHTVEAFHDRDFQDEVIRYLTDAKLRSIDTNTTLLDQNEAERAKRFSHFLARRYYRDRLHRGFRYSTALISPAQAAEHLVDTTEFDSILETCTLGSLDTSRKVGRLALARLLQLRGEEWWSELLDYELAFFIQLATSETTRPTAVARRSQSSILLNFQFRIPELLLHLRSGENLAGDLHGQVALLFSRTHHGKVYIVEADESAIMVFRATDGRKRTEQIASSCGISVEETGRILSTLSDIGAIVPPA